MRIFLAGLLAVVFLLAGTSRATEPEVAGVPFPVRTPAAGKTLILNGAGLRTRFLFKVYVIGLYLERPTTDAATVLGTDSVRRADLHVLRALSGPEIASAIGRAFEQNAGDAAARLKGRLVRFESMFPALETGDTLVLTYVPGQGTSVVAKGKDLGVIEGKDFGDVLFSVWIGAKPVDPALKQALLAGGR
jgi:hypothetical protein